MRVTLIEKSGWRLKFKGAEWSICAALPCTWIWRTRIWFARGGSTAPQSPWQGPAQTLHSHLATGQANKTARQDWPTGSAFNIVLSIAP